MKLTIRKKLLGLSFIAIVIPLIISAAVIVFIVTKKSSEESIKKIQTNSNIATTQYARRMQAISTATKELAITALQYDFVDAFVRAPVPNPAVNAQNELEKRKAINVMEINRKQVDLDYLILTDGRGRVLYRVNNSDHRGDDLAGVDAMVRETIGTRKVNFGSVKLPIDFISAEKLDDALNLGTQKKAIEAALAMEVAVPLIIGDELRGVLVGGDILNNDNTLVDELKQTLFRENLEAGSATIYLGDTAIASSRSGAYGRGIGDTVAPDIYKLVMDQGKEFIGPESIGTTNYISAYVPIKDLSQKIVGIYAVSVREEWFRAFQNFIRNFVVLIIGIAILFSILLTYITAGRLTKPIEEITEAADKISLGDLDVAIKVKTAGDEIEQLGESIDRMRISLKSAIERLRRR